MAYVAIPTIAQPSSSPTLSGDPKPLKTTFINETIFSIPKADSIRRETIGIYPLISPFPHHVCVCMCVYVCMCLCVCDCECMCICVCVCVYVCVCVSVCLCVCVAVCVCVCVSVYAIAPHFSTKKLLGSTPPPHPLFEILYPSMFSKRRECPFSP